MLATSRDLRVDNLLLVAPMTRALTVCLSRVPEGASARASWKLNEDFLKPADPERLRRGHNSLLLMWRTERRLLDRVFVVDLIAPVPPTTPPMIAVGSAAPVAMQSKRNNLRRFTHVVGLDVDLRV